MCESIFNSISIRRGQSFIRRQSRAHKITAVFTFSILHIIAVRSGIALMSGGTCREQGSTDASDSSMCGSNCASRPERASSSSRKISRGQDDFPLASILVADISRSHSFYSSMMSDCSGRNSREETTGSARRGQENRLRSANQEQQVAGGRKESTATRNLHPQ